MIKITEPQLVEKVLSDIHISVIHPLHRAMFEKACERVVENSNSFTDENEMVQAARLTFLAINPVFQSTINSLLQVYDTVTIDYRGLTEVLTKNSPILKPLN